MRFSITQPPHIAAGTSTRQMMQRVTFALLPGIAAEYLWFGAGVLFQIVLAISAAWVVEALMLLLRRRSIAPLLDWSATLTAVLLAVSIPPLAPWWIVVLGAAFAMIFGKQLYGGLGFNPFNPAMLAYAVLLVSFPRHMTAWAPTLELAEHRISFAECWHLIMQHTLPPGGSYDALTMATPLDNLKTQRNLGKALTEIQSAPIFSLLAGKGWQSINLGFLVGGLWLLRRGIITWHIPVAVLASLAGLAFVFFLVSPGDYPTPLFHLLSGGSMLGAFFIATDPVTASTTPKGRLIYGALIGALIFTIRSWGGYPDGVAFAVLLMNLAAPALDYCTQPRVYGR